MRSLRLVRPLTATVLVATTGTLPTFLSGAIGVQLRDELGFRETGLGLAIAMAFGVAALCSVLFGRTVERLGPVRSMRIAAVLSATTMLAVAIGAHSLTSFCAVLVIGGVANAMSQPATNLYITRVVPPHRQGIAFALKQSAIPGSTLLGGLAVPAIALTVGWRWAFVGGAALAIAGALTAVEVAGVTGALPTGTAAGRRDQPIPTLMILGAGVGCGALAASSLGSFMTSSLHRAGFGEGSSGLLAALGSLIVIVVRVALGARADRVRNDSFPLVAAMMFIGAAGFATMSALRTVPLLIGGVVAYAAGWGWPGLFNLAIAQANPNGPAAASGVTQTGTYIGAAAGPFLFGALAEHVSYHVAFVSAAISALLGALCITVGRRRVIAVAARVGVDA